MVSRVSAEEPTKESRGTMRARMAAAVPSTVAASAPGRFSRAMRSAAETWSGSYVQR